ncbi:MAG: hypothetical protein V3V08_07615 [Nannocystaceae bacterium]
MTTATHRSHLLLGLSLWVAWPDLAQARGVGQPADEPSPATGGFSSTPSTAASSEPTPGGPETAPAAESALGPKSHDTTRVHPPEASPDTSPDTRPDRVSAPLPPPPPHADPSTIRRGPWRGVGWVGFRATMTVPLGGELPAKGDVAASGGGVEMGWRIRNLIGVGGGLSRTTHQRSETQYHDPVVGGTVTEYAYGFLTYLDLMSRLYVPLDGRVQPYIDVGGGVAWLEPSDPEVLAIIGGQGKAGIGLDAWIARNLTFGGGLTYRITSLDGAVGHSAHGHLQFGIHW